MAARWWSRMVRALRRTPTKDVTGEDSATLRDKDQDTQGNIFTASDDASGLTTLIHKAIYKDRHSMYDALDEARMSHPQIHLATGIYADTTAGGSAVHGDVVSGPNGNVQRRATYSVRFAGGEEVPELAEVDRRTGLSRKSRAIFENLVHYGDSFHELVYADDGLERIQWIEPREIERCEDDHGRLGKPAFVWRKGTGAYGSGGVGRFVGRWGSRESEVELARFQVAHFRAGSPDLGYGVSNALCAWLLPTAKELALVHSGMTLSRITDPGGRYLVKVDTGMMEGKEREAYLRRERDEITKAIRVSKGGQVQITANLLRQGEPIIIGVSSQRALSGVTHIPSTSGLAAITDVEYQMNRMLSGLGVSKAAYGLPMPYAARGMLDEQMRILGRACRGYREDFENEAVYIYACGMVSYGISSEWLTKRELVFDWPSLTHADDVAFLELTLLRTEVANALFQGAWMPRQDIMLRYMGFSPSDVEKWLSLDLGDDFRSVPRDVPDDVGVEPSGEEPEERRRRIIQASSSLPPDELFKVLDFLFKHKPHLRQSLDYSRDSIAHSLKVRHSPPKRRIADVQAMLQQAELALRHTS